MSMTSTLPKFSTGLNPIIATFTQRSKVPQRGLMSSPEAAPWSDAYIADDPLPPTTKMSAFGYRDEELSYRDGVLDDHALATPVRLLTDEGSRLVSQICRSLECYALESSFIISRRFRGADLVSPLLYNMLRDRRFLQRLSAIAGVPLIPHPIRSATAQINYYEAEHGKMDEVGKWHTDGMNYVFTMLLTDPEEFSGGQFNYFLGRRDTFDRNDVADDAVHTAPLARIGDAVFARGSHIYHGVSPLTSGRRMVLTLSMFSPQFADSDSNDFAHVAADDGIPATLPGWLRLKRPTTSPTRDFALRTSSPVMTWGDVTT